MFENRPEMQTPEYKSWSFSVKCRDHFECQKCHRKGGELHSHHIRKWSSDPRLRYLLSNGICLCEGCHNLVTGHEEDYEEEFKQYIRVNGFKIHGVKKSGPKSNKFKKSKWRPRNIFNRF